MRAIRIQAPAADPASIVLPVFDRPAPEVPPGHCLVEVRSAGVNPSDAKAALGFMPHATWPRTPGRDYAGTVVQGPVGLLGRTVWGCGGDLGIRRDGTHATHLVVPAGSVRPVPAGVGMRDAGAVGVPFVTAYEGLRRAGLPGRGATVLVLGANGAVGQAALQIAAFHGARTLGVVRNAQALAGMPTTNAPLLRLDEEQLPERIRSLNGGQGVDLVFNTVGSPCFALANQCLGTAGHQVFIATIDRAVPFDIFAFYRGQHTYHGVDSLALDCVRCADILERLAPGFALGALRPLTIADDAAYGLDDAAQAYRRVLGGQRRRLVIEPRGATPAPGTAAGPR